MPMRPASSTCSVWMKPCPSSPINWSAERGNSGAALQRSRSRACRACLPSCRQQAARAALDDECRDAFGALRLVGDRHDHQRVGRGAVRDEHLRSVQHPAVAVLDRGGSHRRGITARTGFGQAPRGQLFALGQRHEVLLLLRVAAEHRDVRGAEAVMRGHRQRHARIDASQLFDADAVVDGAHAGAAASPRGTECPSSPRSASFGSSSLGKCCASSHSMTWGRISVSANSRTLLRRRTCSSVRRNPSRSL